MWTEPIIESTGKWIERMKEKTTKMASELEIVR